MKIIHIMDNLNTAGGVNSFVYDLCISQSEMGNDVSLIAILGDEDIVMTQAQEVRNAGIPVYCLCYKTKFDALLCGAPKLRKVIDSISNGDQTICNVHLKLAVLLGCLAVGIRKNIHLVETYHSQYKNYWWQYRFCRHFISMYIPCSYSAEKEMKRRFHIPINKAITIPNGVNQKKIQLIASQNNENQKSNLIIFTSVGRFTEQKNFEISVAAFALANDDRLHYNVYGSGPLEKAIKKASNNSSAISFKGTVNREEIISALNQSDMVVMPSLWEGLSIFMLEAISLGCPLMVSNVDSFRQVLKEEPLKSDETWRRCRWGYLVDTSNICAYREAISDFVNNPSHKDNMQKEVLKIAKEYSIEETAVKYLDAYNSLK